MAGGAKFMRAFGRVAIPNITTYWVIIQFGMLLLIWMKGNNPNDYLLKPGLVMQGEWWRLLTFLMLPETTSPIWSAVALYLFWIMGTALERQWGTAEYNLFLLIGILMNIGAAFLPALAGAREGTGSNFYLLESVFLAFAAHYPEFIVLIYFVLPVKVKWLALLACAALIVQFVMGDWVGRAMVLASVGNCLIFFGKDLLRGLKRVGKEMGRTAKPEAAVEAMHRCVVCGITEKTAPGAEFRYCAACGGKCYCLVHLKGHVCG